jgi:hypothetical protein
MSDFVNPVDLASGDPTHLVLTGTGMVGFSDPLEPYLHIKPAIQSQKAPSNSYRITRARIRNLVADTGVAAFATAQSQMLETPEAAWRSVR